MSDEPRERRHNPGDIHVRREEPLQSAPTPVLNVLWMVLALANAAWTVRLLIVAHRAKR